MEGTIQFYHAQFVQWNLGHKILIQKLSDYFVYNLKVHLFQNDFSADNIPVRAMWQFLFLLRFEESEMLL